MKRRKKLSNFSLLQITNRKKWFNALYARIRSYSYARWLYLNQDLEFSYHDADTTLVDELTVIFLNHKLKRSELNQLALDDDPNVQRAAVSLLNLY
jgi:hypothetical protein